MNVPPTPQEAEIAGVAELRPCPLCRSADISKDRWGPEFPVSAVWCTNCGCSIDDSTACTLFDASVIDRWNDRAHLQRAQGER